MKLKLISTYVMGALFGAGILYLGQYYGVSTWVMDSREPASDGSVVAHAGTPQVKGTSDAVTPTLSPEEKEKQAKESFIATNMKQMTIKEKIGQMFMWQISEKKLSEKTIEMLQETHAGGVILMGNRTLSDVASITKQIRSLETSLPLFISIDQEGGVVKRLIDDPNPGAPELGKEDPEEVCSTIQNTSELLSDNGVNMNFGIVADVGWYKDSFIANRTFHKDVDKVSTLVEEAVTCTTSVFSTVKHFPGHGRTKLNTHVTVPEIDISYEKWKETDAVPFQKAIDAGVDVVMMGHLVYEDIASAPASLSPEHIQEVRDMGFTGIITTDDLGMLEESDHDPYESLDKAINSGIDMMLYVRTDEDPDDLYSHAVESMIKNKQMENRIDESVRRLLEAKYTLVDKQQ